MVKEFSCFILIFKFDLILFVSRLEKVIRANVSNIEQQDSLELNNLIDKFIKEKQKNRLVCDLKEK